MPYVYDPARSKEIGPTRRSEGSQDQMPLAREGGYLDLSTRFRITVLQAGFRVILPATGSNSSPSPEEARALASPNQGWR